MELRRLHAPGPFNPSANAPPKVVKKLLALEFVEMGELRVDIWPEEPVSSDTGGAHRRPSKPPVTTLRVWLECYGRMAAVITSRFPEKAAELWAYQTTIIHAAHTYEGANWVAYDRLYRHEMLAAKNLNWSVPNQRLYSEAFTGRAKRHPQCPHCLSEDHAAAGCPHNPNPPIVGRFQGTPAPPVWAGRIRVAKRSSTEGTGSLQEFQQQPLALHQMSVPARVHQLLRPTCGRQLPE